MSTSREILMSLFIGLVVVLKNYFYAHFCSFSQFQHPNRWVVCSLDFFYEATSIQQANNG